jgi:hypothetical protein
MRLFLSLAALVSAGACFALSALLATAERSAFDPVAFGDRAAASLGDPRVAALAAERITAAVLQQSPDLTAVRPLIRMTAGGLASSDAFRALVRTAARSAHRTAFAEGTQRVVLSVPDVGVLMRSAFERGSPELAARIPDGLQAFVAALDADAATEIVVDLWRLQSRFEGLHRLLLLAGVALLALGVGFAPDRRRGLVGSGVALLAAALVVAVLLRVGGTLLAGSIEDPLARGALVGIWSSFMSELDAWAIFLAGLGVLFTAAGTSLLEAFDPLDWGRRAARVAATRPASRAGRVGWGLGLLAAGGMTALAPTAVLTAAVVAGGVAVGVLGARELFRIVLDSVETTPAMARVAEARRPLLRTAVAVAVLLALGGAWQVLRDPSDDPLPTSVTACNGHAPLCARRIDEVTFAGAHNAMSNTEIADWMFPHHQGSIGRQLRDGVRALLIDVYYGFAGGARIKTDLDLYGPTGEALEHALGPEGVEAAVRIRDRLVGVDEGRRDLYLCHGFCELGAYELVPTLREIRDFLIQRPGEVLLLVVEDYVSPESLAEAFERSGLGALVYREASVPPWPTLGQLVGSGRRVIVFIESGRPGVPWLRPAFKLIQETPYHFTSAEEFSCRPNRGVPDASLFLVNHWIETTPTPLPSNAAVVNALDLLLGRIRECEEERHHLANIVAVDFYGMGDLLRVVDELNGVQSSPGYGAPAPAGSSRQSSARSW